MADARVPGLIGVEWSEPTTSAGRTAAEVLLVGAGGGPVVAVLELADLVVEPADDAAGRRPRRPVWTFLFMPW
jgi:hypothetical protein